MNRTQERYDRLAARLSDLIDAIPATAWDAPSPCEGWTARDVLHHVVTTQRDFLGGMPFAGSGANALGDDLSDLPKAWEIIRDQMSRGLGDPAQEGHAYEGYFGPTTFGQTADTFYSFDLVVHTWDLARATGLSEFEPIPEAEMVLCREAMAPMQDQMRVPGLFGPEFQVPADADPQTAFLAYFGRRAG